MYNTSLKYLETEVDEVRVVLLIDEENRQWYLNISLPKFGIVKCDEVFTSPLVVSANIACEIGYGPAAMMLYKGGIPTDNLLWNLNHSGAPKNIEEWVANYEKRSK